MSPPSTFTAALDRALEELQLAACAEQLSPELRRATLSALVDVARLSGVVEWIANEIAPAPRKRRRSPST